MYGQMILTRVPRPFSEERTVFFKNCAGKNWISTHKRMKLDSCLIPYTKISSHWIKELNVRVKTIIILEENIEKKPQDIGFGSDFLDKTPKAQATKEKYR